jgi:hypothetical protein
MIGGWAKLNTLLTLPFYKHTCMTLLDRIQGRIDQHYGTIQLGGYEDEDYHKATVTDAMLEFAINELKMVIKWIREEQQQQQEQEQEQAQSIKLATPENNVS